MLDNYNCRCIFSSYYRLGNEAQRKESLAQGHVAEGAGSGFKSGSSESRALQLIPYTYHFAMVVMWHEGSVSKYYGGNHLAIDKCIEWTCCTP